MGRPDMRRVLETQGLEAVKNGEVHVPAFVPVAVVMFVVVALLIWVLVAFLRGGYNWARVSLTLPCSSSPSAPSAGSAPARRPVFMVLSVVSFPLEVAAIYFLWHPDTSAYLRDTWVPAVGPVADEEPSEA